MTNRLFGVFCILAVNKFGCGTPSGPRYEESEFVIMGGQSDPDAWPGLRQTP